MIKEIFILSVIIGITLAEPPVNAPYPPSGWRPKGAPFTLPREFLPQQATDLEVTKERVEYAGQLAETTTNVLPSNSYLPPEDEEGEDEGQGTEDLLKVQGLPSNEPNRFNQNGDEQLNQQEYFPPQTRNNFQSQNNRQSGQLRQQQQNSRQQQQQFAQRQFGQQQFGRIRQQQQFGQFNYQQQKQFGQLNEQQFGQNTQQQQQFGQNTQQQQQFGQPNEQQFGQNTPQQPFGSENTQFRKGGFIPQFPPRQTPTQEYGPPKTNNEEAEDGDGDEALGNGAQLGQYNNGNNESEDSEQPTVGTVMALSNGRYYVLTPDNTLQRVVFMTTQDAEEAQTNGFTAQLRYMPVEPIRDPIYAYNEQGQLIRIYKK